MKLLELLNKANAGYPDGFLANYYDEETGERIEGASGDGLAEFIVVEMSETFDPDATDADQIDEATRVIKSAIRELQGVLKAVEK